MQPEFQNPRHNLQVAPTLNPGQNNAGLIGKPFERFYNINFALVSTNQPKIDITNFNTTTKPAREWRRRGIEGRERFRLFRRRSSGVILREMC